MQHCHSKAHSNDDLSASDVCRSHVLRYKCIIRAFNCPVGTTSGLHGPAESSAAQQ